MPEGSVVVHDIGSLRRFRDALKDKRADILQLYEDLVTLTESQQDNWDDPQYIRLNSDIQDYSVASNNLTQNLEDSILYISNLLYKLESI